MKSLFYISWLLLNLPISVIQMNINQDVIRIESTEYFEGYLYKDDQLYQEVAIENEVVEIAGIEEGIYTLKANTSYSVTVMGKTRIPVGYSMLFLPRSTLLRSFISVDTAVGDPGFVGTLQFLITNNGDYDYRIKKGERIVQAVVFRVEGSGKYDGSYQEE